MECFAFGGATVRFASLETSVHAAHHTIPPPPSYEGPPHCPKDKNRSPFHGKKPMMTIAKKSLPLSRGKGRPPANGRPTTRPKGGETAK
ncbi:MAG: hypothetical protein SO048_03405 [Sodaliphilus sp.]|nr:hypothetical protein [Sodaliphilus sp.]